MLLRNVTQVPSLSYYLFYLSVAVDNGYTYTGTRQGVTLNLSSGEILFFSSVGRLNFLYAYRPSALVDESASAVITPGPMPNNRDTPIDNNTFHVARAYAHEGALRKTAKQLGITLEGKMHEWLFSGEWDPHVRPIQDG